ncbi:MAG: response regulator [Nitrospirae bacterium]|nr:response regulator [Nitrospirota bacterium]
MGRRLLLADDSITIQKVVELVLAEEDFEIKSVSNGEEAIRLLDAFKPDVVLADIEMPKVNGYQLCETIKKNPGTSKTPVILLAGAFEPIDNDLARKVGADDSVIKPFESQELISKINAVLAMGSAEEFETAAIEESGDDIFELAEEAAGADQSDAFEVMADEDLWTVEETAGVAPEFAAEAVAEEVPAEVEVFAEPRVMKPAELPKAAPVIQPPFPSAEKREFVAPEISLPSKSEIMSMIDGKIDEKLSKLFASLDIRDALLKAATPVIRDTIEKILWEMAPELVDRATKETMQGAFGSISKEVEKVLWETVPELAATMISKEIEKIKAEF